MSTKTPAAPGQYLGYTLQTVRMCYYLASCQPNQSVALEVFEDVGVIGENGVTLAEQTKSALTHNPVSDWAIDLWKTFSNWADAIKNGAIENVDTAFRLYSAQKHTGNIVRRFSQANTLAEAKDALRQVNSEFRQKNKRATGSLKYIENFFDADFEVQARIVCQFSYESGSNNPVLELKNKLSLGLSEPIQDLACLYVLGWVQKEVIDLISKQMPAVVQAKKFREDYAGFVRKHQNDSVLPIFSKEPSDSVLEDAIAHMPKYVQQLELINADADLKIAAVSDFLRTSSEKTMWSDRSVVLPDSFLELDSELQKKWSLDSRLVRLKNKGYSEEDLGMILYLESIGHEHKIDTRHLPRFFVAGAHHSLANLLKIGWHASYKSKMQS